ncbi:MAG TPA: DsbE family thiol:disulfide interchange protein [Methylococcus sp.]|nr:DsbE family thiol:disulfide interchange protein [Methylococcus sp.]
MTTSRMRFALPLLVFALLVALLAVGLRLDPREVPSPLIGKPAPGFSLPQVAAAEQRLSLADLKGQVFLLNVWASWCLSCREEHPLLLELAKRGIVPIYGLNYKDERETAQAWLKRFGDPYRASAFDADGRIGIEWGVYGVPETFVVDKQGLIRYKQTGPITPEVLEKKILPLVRQLQEAA